jgi:hypothetical protein
MKKSKDNILKVGPSSPLLKEDCDFFVIDNEVYSCENITVADCIRSGYKAGVLKDGRVWEKE